MQSVQRESVRVAAVNEEGRALLLHSVLPYDEWWELPGGGIDPGEAPEDAAVRELAEETGLRVNQLEMHLGTVDTEFVFEGRRYLQREAVYLVSVPGTPPVELPEPDPPPAARHTAFRWWHPDELAGTDEQIHPPQLCSLLRGASRSLRK